ncbi:hypothetical protein PHLCEN_2v2773 [Hermanssonia centrifuga]|uniref:Uncharacterized protein n=1 Tax=Hermanssonia centrifuga TaxID=98765 RepID=A0A2R6RHX6_9APHY|nr:hypothetical protein PHLCEN_2v2773 [Hermanssonia centrifuga]
MPRRPRTRRSAVVLDSSEKLESSSEYFTFFLGRRAIFARSITQSMWQRAAGEKEREVNHEIVGN